MSAEIRPRFHRTSPLAPEAVLKRFSDRADQDFQCAVLGDHVQISVAPEAAHLYSPWLTFEVRDAESGSVLEGRFSSNPTFFTMYAAALAAVLLLTLGFGIFGMAQSSLGQNAWGLWAWPVGLVLFAVLLSVPFLGQRLSRDQLERMNAFVTARGELNQS